MASDSEKKASVREDQLLVMRGIVAGGVFLLLVALLAVYGPIPRPHLPSLEDKLVFTLQWQAVSALALIAGLVWVEATRALTTAINPLDKEAEKQNLSGVAPRYTSNTLEQYLLSSGASLILSTHLPSENMHVIPVLVILFTFGRLTFALGYKYYHAHRAFGHMVTAFPTVCVYVYCVYRLVMNNFGYNRSSQLSRLVAAVLPCLPFVPVPEFSHYNRLYLKGSTHRYKEMHSDYIQTVIQPFIRKFGFDFGYDIRKRSYSPFWDGKICLESLPVYSLLPINMTESGTVKKISGWTFVSGDKPIRIAQIMSKEAHHLLKENLPGVPLNISSQRDRDSRREGTGQGLMLLAETSTGVVLSGTALWKRGMSPDEVVNAAVRMLLYNLNSGSCVDDMLQDQAILFMSLASGKSSLRVSHLNKRSKAMIKAIETFTEVKFNVAPAGVVKGTKTRRNILIECEGQGLINEDVVPPEDSLERVDTTV